MFAPLETIEFRHFLPEAMETARTIRISVCGPDVVAFHPHRQAILANWIADPGAIWNLIDVMPPSLQSVRRTEW